jgi:cytochrome oxidase Cu insertion factor (SCO1/SenC/PrrC family)
VRRYVVTKSAVVLVVFLALAAIAFRFTVSTPSNVVGAVIAHRIANDPLTSDTAEIIHLDKVPRGALIVVGYTRCTDACPIAIAKVVAAARPLRRDIRPSLFFLTVDPAHDTPTVLHRYLAAWRNEVVGLTGERNALARISASLGAGAASRSPSDHDTRLFLIDHTGGLVSDITPDVAVTELRRLLLAVQTPGPT